MLREAKAGIARTVSGGFSMGSSSVSGRSSAGSAAQRSSEQSTEQVTKVGPARVAEVPAAKFETEPLGVSHTHDERDTSLTGSAVEVLEEHAGAAPAAPDTAVEVPAIEAELPISPTSPADGFPARTSSWRQSREKPLRLPDLPDYQATIAAAKFATEPGGVSSSPRQPAAEERSSVSARQPRGHSEADMPPRMTAADASGFPQRTSSWSKRSARGKKPLPLIFPREDPGTDAQ
eukprot:gnl/TRDRNA2_/TRDRNA2_139470_c0_seq1.p1 gnl/TRDRNA2_/TRDRNA2_139470_c0~~gnl/TRDRNA2_/TRDRNA2_139470_c0_seq1.p1  ORF type:complete len:268 (-),score=42.54 gnl/TRDRNA2_/TRDRNA2_139470_c0_seq1:26-727(-)